MRIALAFAAALFATASSALALDTTRMSCGEARAAVARAGAVVLHSGPGIYDRYVAATQFCAIGEVMRPAFVPTRDAASCPVGATCVTPENHRFFLGD